jgi:hypothetical protein
VTVAMIVVVPMIMIMIVIMYRVVIVVSRRHLRIKDPVATLESMVRGGIRRGGMNESNAHWHSG